MDTDKIRRQMNKQNTSPKQSTLVQDLRHGMKKVNIEAKVLETPTPSTVQTRYGNSAKVTNAWIADETGKIKLCLWNEQVDFVTVGDTVQIKNASVSTFKVKGNCGSEKPEQSAYCKTESIDKTRPKLSRKTESTLKLPIFDYKHSFADFALIRLIFIFTNVAVQLAVRNPVFFK